MRLAASTINRLDPKVSTASITIADDDLLDVLPSRSRLVSARITTELDRAHREFAWPCNDFNRSTSLMGPVTGTREIGRNPL